MVFQDDIDVCLQPIQEKFVRISLLQNYFIVEEGYPSRKSRKIGEIQGNTVGGSINIDANSATRRTCTIDLVITDSSFLVSENTKIWMDKWFQVELGIRSLKSGEIVWFNKGIFAIYNPSVKYNSSEKSLKIQGLDLMSTLDGSIGGQLKNITKIEEGTPLSTAIKQIACQIGQISCDDIYIEQNPILLPHDIEKKQTDTVYSLLKEIGDLYMNWEFFFDVNGRFVYRRIRSRYLEGSSPEYEDDVLQFAFLEENEVVSDYSYNFLFSNVKNRIVIWGRMLDDGEQIFYEMVNTDENSPFNIHSKIGEVPFVIVDSKIQDNEQAKQRCEYEFYKHNNMNEQVNAQLLPLYFLDVNRLVEFDKTELRLKGKFLITRITVPLGIEEEMSISAHKVYAE